MTFRWSKSALGPKLWMRSAHFVSVRIVRRQAVRALFLTVTASAFTPAFSEDRPTDSSFSLSTGYSLWNGKFGAATDTLIWSALIDARYQVGGLRLTAVLPRMRIRSDGTFFAGLGGTPLFVAPNIASTKRVRDGWGDLTLGAAYLLPGGEGRGFDVELNGRVKIPTATNASQLSTGKTDYSVGAEFSATRGRLTPAVSMTYRIFGDAPGWDFRNGFYITAGGSYGITPRTSFVLTYEYTQAATHFIGDAHELVAGVSTAISRTPLRLTGYVSKGLSQGASDVSAGALISLVL